MATRLVFAGFGGLGSLVLGGVFGCTESTLNPPRSALSPAPTVSASVGRPATAAKVEHPELANEGDVVTMPDGRGSWRSTPKETNGFYPVLDGLCSKLGMGRVGKDVIVYYGGTPTSSYNTNERWGLASFIALKDSGLEDIGDPPISSPTGLAGSSAEDFWIANSTGSRSSEGAVLHRRTAGAWKTYEKDQTHLHAWTDGGIIGTLGMARTNGDVWVEGSSTKPPQSLSSGFGFPVLSAFPTGEVALLVHSGEWGKSPWVARHWSPTKQVTAHTLTSLDQDSWPTLVETAPDELYAYAKDGVVAYDGTSWKSLGKTSHHDNIAWAKRAAKGEVWVRLENGNIERSTDKGFVAVVTPEPLEAIDGIDSPTPYGVGKSGKLYKRDGEAWKEIKLPAPSFGLATAVKAKGVLVVGADDVIVQTAYWEKGPGWTEQELHWMLVRTKAPKETMRCNEPDPENNNIYMGRGFQSWPPFATAECKTPFVILSRRSKAKSKVPTDTDWKAIRGALTGKADLFADAKLIELVSGDRTFLGAKAKTFDAAKEIARLAAAKDRIRPEVLCAEPPPATREIPIE